MPFGFCTTLGILGDPGVVTHRYCCIMRKPEALGKKQGSLLSTKLITHVPRRSKLALKILSRGLSETWQTGHLPIVRLRRAVRHLRAGVKLGGVRHRLDDGPLAAVARSCGERPCHLVYGRARRERVLGVTGYGRERFLSVEKEDTQCNTMHVKPCTFSYSQRQHR